MNYGKCGTKKFLLWKWNVSSSIDSVGNQNNLFFDDKQDNPNEGLFFLLYFVLVLSHSPIMFDIQRIMCIRMHFQAFLPYLESNL